jgi:hypothetical protein
MGSIFGVRRVMQHVAGETVYNRLMPLDQERKRLLIARQAAVNRLQIRVHLHLARFIRIDGIRRREVSSLAGARCQVSGVGPGIRCQVSGVRDEGPGNQPET